MNKIIYIPKLYEHIIFENSSFNIIATSDKHSLNNMHTNSGYSNHTNTGANNHNQSGYANHNNSGYNNWNNSGYSNHSKNCNNNWKEYFNYHPGWVNTGCPNGCNDSGCGNHNNGGYNNHSNSGCGNHTNSGYSNHTNTGANNHTNYSNNYSPKITGSCLPASGVFNQSVTLDWRGCTITHTNVSSNSSDSATNKVKSYNIYYKRSSSTWTKLTTGVTAQTYTVDTSKYAAGVITFAITAYDGLEESVVFSNGSFSSPPKGDASSAPGASYITTGELTISHYTAPEWKYVVAPGQPIRAYDAREVHDEIVKAAESYGVTGITSMTSPIKEYPYTGDTRAILKSDLTKMQTDGNTANNSINGSNYSFSLAASSVVTKQTTVMGREILELRNMVEGFEQ